MSERRVLESVRSIVLDAEREHKDVANDGERLILVVDAIARDLKAEGITFHVEQRTGDEPV